MNYKIILASNSPRRKELLAGLDIPFEVKVIKGIDESYPETLDAYEVAEYISSKKAEAYRGLLDEEPGEEAVQTLILTADTVVIAPAADVQNDQEGKGVILGKPKDEEDAVRMLRMLSGKTHHVVTGVCLTTRSQQRHFSVTTEVTFKHLSDAEISYYISHYKPFDKAGAYGIQEWIGYGQSRHDSFGKAHLPFLAYCHNADPDVCDWTRVCDWQQVGLDVFVVE